MTTRIQYSGRFSPLPLITLLLLLVLFGTRSAYALPSLALQPSTITPRLTLDMPIADQWSIVGKYAWGNVLGVDFIGDTTENLIQSENLANYNGFALGGRYYFGQEHKGFYAQTALAHTMLKDPAYTPLSMLDLKSDTVLSELKNYSSLGLGLGWKSGHWRLGRVGIGLGMDTHYYKVLRKETQFTENLGEILEAKDVDGFLAMVINLGAAELVNGMLLPYQGLTVNLWLDFKWLTSR